MELKWEYPLPTNKYSNDFQYESPILENGDYLYFVGTFTGQQTLHIICKESGKGNEAPLPQSVQILPSKYIFFSYNTRTVIYAGDLHFIQNAEIIKSLDFLEKGVVTSHLLCDNRLYVSCNNRKQASLWCIDLDKMVFLWNLDISNTKPYCAGELTFFDDMISCYGRDQLLFIRPSDGAIIRTIKLSRIDKLYCPIRLDDDTMLIGYTNWSNAGILKYQITTQKIVWRHKRKFEGPQLKCKIYLHGNTAYWAKNSTELIGLNIENGEEIFNHRTTPWLYTDLRFVCDTLLYGTAGADGYLNCLDCKTGIVKWSAFLKNGCAYYGIGDHSVFAGDFEKTIKQFNLSDGMLLREMPVDGEVVGQVTVSKDHLYTVIWGNAEKDIRLVKIQIS